MKTDALKDFPLDSKVGSVHNLLRILVALEVIPYDVILEALADEAIADPE